MNFSTDGELRRAFENEERLVLDHKRVWQTILHYPTEQIIAVGLNDWRSEILDGYDTYLADKDRLELWRKVFKSRKCHSQEQNAQNYIETELRLTVENTENTCKKKKKDTRKEKERATLS